MPDEFISTLGKGAGRASNISTISTIVSTPAICFQHLLDIYTAMYMAFPENKWVERMAASFKTLDNEHITAVCYMMACDIDNLAIQIGFTNSRSLISHMISELATNTPVTICRLQFMANVSMSQMIELTSKAGVANLCAQLGKLLACFECPGLVN